MISPSEDMHTAQQERDEGSRQVGMCKRCGEAYYDIGTTAQRKAWMATHGADCTREPEQMDLATTQIMLKVLLAMPTATVAQ